jgi:hypothetical protein
MKTKLINDVEQIKKVLCHPDIYKTISGKDCPITADDFEPPLKGCEYLAGFHKGEIFAIMVYDGRSGRTEIHIQVLPQYRKEFAREFARIALDHGIAKNVPLYADIATKYPNVIKFAESFGFNAVEKNQNNVLLRY